MPIKTPRKRTRYSFITPNKRRSTARALSDSLSKEESFARRIEKERKMTEGRLFAEKKKRSARTVADKDTTINQSSSFSQTLPSEHHTGIKEDTYYDKQAQNSSKKKDKGKRTKKINKAEPEKDNQQNMADTKNKKKEQESKKQLDKTNKRKLVKLEEKKQNQGDDHTEVTTITERGDTELPESLIERRAVLGRESLFLESKLQKLTGSLVTELQTENTLLRDRLAIEQLIGFRLLTAEKDEMVLCYKAYNKELRFKLVCSGDNVDYSLVECNVIDELPDFLRNDMYFGMDQMPKFIYNVIKTMIGKDSTE